MKATRAIALASVTAIALAACGSDSDSDAPAETTAEAEETTDEGAAEEADEGAEESAAACPSELVIQTDWFPELEHGGTYQLIGPDGTADKDTVSYSGPVQAQYAVGGLETVTIKTVNFDKSNASVLADGDADMAYITTSAPPAPAGVSVVKPPFSRPSANEEYVGPKSVNFQPKISS